MMQFQNQTMTIDYNHSHNLHSLSGPRAAFPAIFAGTSPKSLLDVGCGLGTWLKAAQEAGVADVFGIDGIAVAPEKFLVSKTLFRQQDLNQSWDVGRRFDAALCLEVAEHLDEKFAVNLIEALTRHADTVVFGAACPGQTGQHHVNCQWPAYWQKLFNDLGYVCTDEVRWRIWQDERIEPWYRQNLFVARRDPARAGNEARILPVMHPDILPLILQEELSQSIDRIAGGALPAKWYANSFPKMLFSKFSNLFK